MFKKTKPLFEATLEKIREVDLSKTEWPLHSPQATTIHIQGREILNLCSSNYLGLANDPNLIATAKKALEARGGVRHGLGPLYLRHPRPAPGP